MSIYFFHFNAEPTKGSSDFGELAGALVEAWVYSPASTIQEAAALAKAKIMGHSWVVTGVEHEAEMPEEPNAYTDEFAPHARHALQKGVHLVFVGYPIEEREDGAVEIRRMQPADEPSKTEN